MLKFDYSKYREETIRRAQLFVPELEDLIKYLKLEPVKFFPYDTLTLWDDVKVSTNYVEIIKPGRVGMGLETFEWGDPKKYANTQKILQKYFKKASELYSIEYTSHLRQWYVVFKEAYLDFKCYEPSQTEYQHFFTLQGTGKIEQLEDLVGGGILFYRLVNRLFSLQVPITRTAILQKILKDPENLEKLQSNTYTAPTSTKALLTTPQVYQAYRLKYPLRPATPEELQELEETRKQVTKALSNWKDYSPEAVAARNYLTSLQRTDPTTYKKLQDQLLQ